MDQFQQFDISDFFNHLEEPVFLMDSEEIIFFNRHFLENYLSIGDNWRSYFGHGETITDLDNFFSEGNTSLPKVQVNLTSKAGQVAEFEWCFTPLPSSYSTRFLIAKGQKIQKSTNSIQGVQGNLEDAIGREHRYMQSILTNYHDLIAIFDQEGNYLYVSNSVEKNVGIPASDLLGRNYKEFVAAGIFEIVKGSFEEILNSKEEVALDFWINLSTGRRIYLESFARNLLDHPQIQGILFSSRDITEFILTEQSLQRRYEIENQINLISTQLINGRWSNLEDEFDKALIQFGEMLKAEDSKILIINRDTRELEVLNQWSKSGDQSTVTSPRYFALINAVKEELENGKVVQKPLKVK
ncbi:MAG: PAS domain S-box protein, partial [Algoriphagus sp.]|nr:PAS domain S-box protein [Algoriphagus sp.]